jgi:hypothetical protein
LQTNVIRCGAVYYYRVSFPLDLMAVNRRRENWRSLNASDPLLARARQARAEVVHELADEDLNALVKQYYESELASEDSQRLSERTEYD